MKGLGNFSRGACVAAFVALAPAIAQAADGTITFKGAITAQTCKVKGSGGGADFDVTLPTIPATQLDAPGKEAGYTPFSIALTDCEEDDAKVYTFFEAGPTVDPGTGRLNVEGQGSAKNLQVALTNADFTDIKVGTEAGAQNSKPVAIKDGSAELNYYVKYVATGKVEAGEVNTHVQYSIAYE